MAVLQFIKQSYFIAVKVKTTFIAVKVKTTFIAVKVKTTTTTRIEY